MNVRGHLGDCLQTLLLREWSVVAPLDERTDKCLGMYCICFSLWFLIRSIICTLFHICVIRSVLLCALREYRWTWTSAVHTVHIYVSLSLRSVYIFRGYPHLVILVVPFCCMFLSAGAACVRACVGGVDVLCVCVCTEWKPSHLCKIPSQRLT